MCSSTIMHKEKRSLSRVLKSRLRVREEEGGREGHRRYGRERKPFVSLSWLSNFDVLLPASQVLGKGDKTRSRKRGHNRKLSPNDDFGSGGGLEKLDRDHKIGKWQNSFGSGRLEDADQKPRECNCSNSIPIYMQAMESTRAKALATSSQKSIPDVRDKQIYVEKRDPLPSANGR
ncbi:hypothetical protein Vadar_003692 [Vaccinium darrowii]|uniref:Uncharacterized protein n=1 Tax=Vaccinium darrowii TaxID=229202 RepID=A0ACB7XXC6_9ERIC|nr:hypothetical protein Vadar_003692 [Vaccinium darrowii]